MKERRLSARSRTVIGTTLIAVAAVAALSPSSAELVERWFSMGAYPHVQRVLTSTSNLLPLAWLDVIVLAALAWQARLWARTFRSPGKGPLRRRAARASFTTLAGGAVIYLVFLALWGLNYRRVPLATQLLLEESAPSTDAVVDLGFDVAGRLNALHAFAHARRWPEPVWQNASLRRASSDVQRLLGRSQSAVPGRLKATLLGPVFRWNAVDGMINPFGLEVLANPDLLPVERPFVAAHEWAHLAGYADEAEANFVGWLTCLQADLPSQYSGWLYLYWQIVGELGAGERKRIDETLGAGPRRDLNAIAERLRRGDLPFLRRVSWAAYDTYLKANRVEEGIRSYGEVLTLILRARFEDGWRPVLRGDR